MPHPTPIIRTHLSGETIQALREFHLEVEEVREQLDAAVEAAALQIPAIASLIEHLPASAREEQAATSRALEKAALWDGQWEAYVENLSEQGASYAEMGVPFADWYALLGAYREVILERVVPPNMARARSVLHGMSVFLDVAMSAMANAYVAKKEDLLRSAESQLGLYIDMFRHAPVGMLIYRWEAPRDAGSFRLIAANAAAAQMTAATVGTLVSEEQPQIVEQKGPRYYVEALESDQPQAWTARWATPGRRERIFRSRAFRLDDSHVGVIFEDVTEQEDMQRALARHARDLERSNRELDDFAYVASHDLKAPLRDVDNLAQWIAEDAGDVLSEGSRRHLTLLEDRVRRMERLLDDLLGYSRAGRVFQESAEIDVRRALESAVALASVPSAFSVEVSGDARGLHAPPAAVEQVLRNLISNAVKHHDREDGRIQISLREDGGQVVICVQDDGPGIPPAFHERVFRMFQTLRPRDEVEGSGMGLPIVKKLVEAHGGTVQLESSPGEGTTVLIRWPRDGKGDRS